MIFAGAFAFFGLGPLEFLALLAVGIFLFLPTLFPKIVRRTIATARVIKEMKRAFEESDREDD
ncbi:MAG: hypothetical protein CVT63_05285 [Candidatus Anoxymicrobium japonicum]|uniref:Sec-independent protein translocase protein TatA n=1 Tax=Candidatus Anoxymicrobium japonicum TaxID=2013648 RepID=A0A2N3G5U5_9ACTN|nr:MAG: hypothetical protein CVT63_05285 [Candidatus Anoxymicrobium japonicum]